MVQACPKRSGATYFVCNKVRHIATQCPHRINTATGPSQTTGIMATTGPRNGNNHASKAAMAARVFAMQRTPVEDDDAMMEEDYEGNLWEEADPDDYGLIAGM